MFVKIVAFANSGAFGVQSANGNRHKHPQDSLGRGW